jgi:hypothetical protein
MSGVSYENCATAAPAVEADFLKGRMVPRTWCEYGELYGALNPLWEFNG